jgi:hypothetical protein
MDTPVSALPIKRTKHKFEKKKSSEIGEIALGEISWYITTYTYNYCL